MVLSEIWKQRARVSSSMTPKLHESAVRVISKLHAKPYMHATTRDNIKGNIRKKNTKQYNCTYIAIASLHFFLKNFTPTTS